MAQQSGFGNDVLYIGLSGDRCIRLDKYGMRVVYENGKVSESRSWDYLASSSGLPFTDAELERFQETLRQGSGWNVTATPQWQTAKIITGEEWQRMKEEYEAALGMPGPPPLEVEVSLCTAKPSCGFPDEECPVCKAGNCPGVKCWRCGGKR
jgi:hypothetical protein